MLTLHTDPVSNIPLIFLHQTRIRSQLIYCLTLFAIVLTLGSLPFLYTTISIKSMGLMQSSVERTDLLAPISGRLLHVNLIDNQKVAKGSILVIIDGSLPRQQKDLLSNHALELKEQLKDAEVLIKEINEPQKIENHLPKTKLYAASWQQYMEQFQNATHAKQQAERIYLRYRALYNKNVVTLSEFEQYKFNFDQALSEQQAVSKKYINQWQVEANHYHNELRDLQNQQAQLHELVKQCSLKATINGSIQNLTGVQKGSYVYANQRLGEISPDSALLAYCYVKPSAVGLLKKGQPVHLQVDAFNYNQWGMLTGKIIDISDDIIIQNQLPYFKIKCQLDRNYLQLKSGYKGYMKKGMTLSANFTIAKRTLYQLLYDRVDHWLNPS